MYLPLIILGIFEFAFDFGAITSFIDLIRSRRFISTKAKLIDNVAQYSKEWGKYFPEMYAKKEKFQEFLGKAEDKINDVSDALPPVSVRKSGKTIVVSKRNTDPIDLTSQDPESIDTVYIYEYEVDGKKYYYEQYSGSKVLGVAEKGKLRELRYDPKKPSHAVVAKQNVRNILICACMALLFGILMLMVAQKY